MKHMFDTNVISLFHNLIETESATTGLSLTAEQVDALLLFSLRVVEIAGRLGLGKYRGPTEVLMNHVIDSLAFFHAFPEAKGRLADVGSGSGFPGIVLAIAEPELDVVLIESRRRPVWFLRQMVAELGLGNARVVRGRAEELGEMKEYRGMFRFATARGVTRPRKTTALLRPFLFPGGHAVIYTGRTALERDFPGGEVPASDEYCRAVMREEGGGEPGKRVLVILEAREPTSSEL